ncbi:hypothetical protein G9373_40520 [Rhodococcus sp. A14]|nr:hypothetical protein [Rhodococcus sp. A14]
MHEDHDGEPGHGGEPLLAATSNAAMDVWMPSSRRRRAATDQITAHRTAG